ncbi:MAG TPA: hypothetical protein VIY48_01895 [Candidatus Paceibacterota bacterium]
MKELQPGEFICPRCHEYILDAERRYHPCQKVGERAAYPTLYLPNTGKQTKNSDPAYRKHAGSRPQMKRMIARLKGRGLFTDWRKLFVDIPFVQSDSDKLIARLSRGAGKTTFANRLRGSQ